MEGWARSSLWGARRLWAPHAHMTRSRVVCGRLLNLRPLSGESKTFSSPLTRVARPRLPELQLSKLGGDLGCWPLGREDFLSRMKKKTLFSLAAFPEFTPPLGGLRVPTFVLSKSIRWEGYPRYRVRCWSDCLPLGSVSNCGLK